MNRKTAILLLLASSFTLTAAQAQQSGMSVQLGTPWITGGQGAFVGGSAASYASGASAAAGAAAGATGGLSAQDMMRLQQARNAHGNYVRNVGGYGKFGSHGETVERIDTTFSANGKNLSEYDYYDLVRQYDSLKEQIIKSVAQGESDSQYQERLQQFEDELNRRISAANESRDQAKKEIEQSIDELNSAFQDARSSLSEADAADLTRKIRSLKDRIATENPSQIISEVRQLKSAIESRSNGPTVLSGLGRENTPASTPQPDATMRAPNQSTPEAPKVQNQRIRRPGY